MTKLSALARACRSIRGCARRRPCGSGLRPITVCRSGEGYTCHSSYWDIISCSTRSSSYSRSHPQRGTVDQRSACNGNTAAKWKVMKLNHQDETENSGEHPILCSGFNATNTLDSYIDRSLAAPPPHQFLGRVRKMQIEDLFSPFHDLESPILVEPDRVRVLLEYV